MMRRPRKSPPFPYTPLSRSPLINLQCVESRTCGAAPPRPVGIGRAPRPRAQGSPSPDRAILGLVVGGLGLSRSEEHTSELQSRPHLACRLLLEKKIHNILTD